MGLIETTYDDENEILCLCWFSNARLMNGFRVAIFVSIVISSINNTQ